MRLRLSLVLLAAALLLAACSSPGDEPLPLLLDQLGFSQTKAPHPGELLFKKPLDGVTLWVSLPQGWEQRPGPLMMIKAAGPDGTLNQATDQALTNRPEVSRLVEEASQGAYPPEALAEIFKLAQEAAAQPPHNGALMTSPKHGYSLRVPHTKGHLRLLLLALHNKP